MVKQMKAAQKAARKAIEATYFGTLTVTVHQTVKDEKTKLTKSVETGGSVVPDGYFDPTALIIEADGIKIEVDQTMTATIHFDPVVSLPEEYNFTHYASYADTAAVANYLKSEYRELIGMDNPQVNIHGGDYNIYSQQSFSIEFFDAADHDIEQIINYNFNRVAFYCDDNGKLFLARVFQPDLSKKMGDQFG